ncbi:MAG TPA: hypothetical protein DCE41_07370 [Cytophagales bacterium]|nr:hypothetical protein [Cytophagales bacterium]HAA23810.1 hypothetical protein [Cytophagales bacterium]HAP61553.1 hypothetical protein [Cytophagales bacterium]
MIAVLAQETFDITLYPMQDNQHVLLVVSAEVPQEIRISVFDSEGKVLQKKEPDHRGLCFLKTSILAPGYYDLEVASPTLSIHRRLFVHHTLGECSLAPEGNHR